MEKTRSTAQERRLRQRRSDARIRLRLAADAVLLSDHHTSDVPQQPAHSPLRGNKVIELLEQLVAQQSALFSVIASMNGWQAGMFHGVCGGPDLLSSTVPEGHAGYTSPSDVDSGDVRDPGVCPVVPEGPPPCQAELAASVAEARAVCVARPAGVGETFDVEVPISYQQFLASDHYDYFRHDLTLVQRSYLESFQYIGCPADWRMEDALARVLSRNPHTPDLLSFDVKDLYSLVMLRRGNVDWNILASNVSEMTPDDRDAFFVDFVKRRCQQGGGVALGHN